MRDTGRRTSVDPSEHRRLLQAFVTAAQAGDLATLEQLLAADVVSYSDGGGLVRAARIPVQGRTRVARFIRAFATRFWSGVELTWVEANARPAVLVTRDGTAVALVAVSATAEGIEQALWMVNPQKLTTLRPPTP